MRIHKTKEHITSSGLEWSNEERAQLERDILNLRDDQIGALARILVGFKNEDIPDIVRDIKQNKVGSGHLPILLEEADSKDEVRWWIDYFTSHNK